MKRGVKIILIVIALVLVTAVVTGGWLFSEALPIGTGFVAKYICSSTFISNRDPEIVFAEEVEPVNILTKVVDYRINREQKSVTENSTRTKIGNTKHTANEKWEYKAAREQKFAIASYMCCYTLEFD